MWVQLVTCRMSRCPPSKLLLAGTLRALSHTIENTRMIQEVVVGNLLFDLRRLGLIGGTPSSVRVPASAKEGIGDGGLHAVVGQCRRRGP